MRPTAIVAVVTLVPSLLIAQPAPANGPPAPAPTPRSGPTLGFVTDVSLEMGGDDILTVAFTNGENQTIRAGDGGTLAIGGILRPSAGSPLSLRATAGIKFSGTAADDANIFFLRAPVELVGTYALTNGARIGAGLVSHVWNRYKGDGFFPDQSYAAATGFTAEVGYKAFAVTYTTMTYKQQGGASYDAGSFGLQALWTPKRKRR
jgi:hypothetical protein